MAIEVRSSYSPAIGMPRAVRSEAPRIMPGAEAFVLFAVEAAVVVGQRVEVEVLDEPVQADRDLGAPGEVVVVDGVVEVNSSPGQVHALARPRRR